MQAVRPRHESEAVKHSLHSLERFYTKEQSLALWAQLTRK